MTFLRFAEGIFWGFFMRQLENWENYISVIYGGYFVCVCFFLICGGVLATVYRGERGEMVLWKNGAVLDVGLCFGLPEKLAKMVPLDPHSHGSLKHTTLYTTHKCVTENHAHIFLGFLLFVWMYARNQKDDIPANRDRNSGVFFCESCKIGIITFLRFMKRILYFFYSLGILAAVLRGERGAKWNSGKMKRCLMWNFVSGCPKNWQKWSLSTRFRIYTLSCNTVPWSFFCRAMRAVDAAAKKKEKRKKKKCSAQFPSARL